MLKLLLNFPFGDIISFFFFGEPEYPTQKKQ